MLRNVFPQSDAMATIRGRHFLKNPQTSKIADKVRTSDTVTTVCSRRSLSVLLVAMETSHTIRTAQLLA